MNNNEIIIAIDLEIKKLQQARALLVGSTKATSAPKKKRRHGNMSAEGRKRIAEAQRRRWAKIRAGK